MQSAKQHVCPVEGRRFATKEALADHRRDVHNLGASAKAVAPRGRFRGGRGRGRTFRGRANLGFVPAPLSVPANESSNNRVHGEDRVTRYTAHRVGILLERIAIRSDMSPRLSSLSHAYQKMRWERCEIIVSPQAPLTTSGGYVAGFVMDPEDLSVTIEQLASSQGAVTKKWYETSSLVMPTTRMDYFTQFGTDVRLSSPANFWVISDGNPTQDVAIVVTVRWQVTFTKAALADTYSFTSSYSLTSVKSNYNMQINIDKNWSDDVSAMMPAVLPPTKQYLYYRVPTFMIEYAEGTGDTGTKQMHFVAYHPGTRRMYYSQDGTKIDNTPWQSDLDYQTLIPCGTTFKFAGTGNPSCLQQRPSSLLKASQDSIVLSEQQILFLENLLHSLAVGRRGSTASSLDCEIVKPPEQGPS